MQAPRLRIYLLLVGDLKSADEIICAMSSFKITIEQSRNSEAECKCSTFNSTQSNSTLSTSKAPQNSRQPHLAKNEMINLDNVLLEKMQT